MNLSLSLINLKKQVFAMMLLSICIMANIAYAGGVADGFEKREKYKNATRLGNPKKYEKLIKKDEDVTHLKNLTDNGLFDGGARELKGSEMGLFLTKSEEKKIEAKEQYQINSDNQYLKDSIAISRDPMSKTGGGSLSVQECHESAPFKKKCIEGVNFEVDVGRELVLDAHEEEYLSPEKSEKKEIALHGGWIWHNYPGWLYPIKWKKGRYGLHMRQGHPVVMAELRVHISQATNTPIENINPHIDFEPRGEGHTSNVHDDLNVFHIYRIHYTVKWQDTLKKLVEDGQYWQPVTEDMDKLVESHQCHEVGRECIKSGSKTFFDKYEISRPCWYEKVTFKCKSEPVGGCLHLSKKGCNLKDSVCKERLGSICLKWEREYICGGKKTRLRSSLADSSIYCLGGDCHEPVIEENKDISNVAYLAATKEAHKDCTKEPNGSCKNPITVFPGEADKCKKIIASVIDCCSSMDGWAKNANLCQCSGAEKGLAIKRDRGLCHQVGTYCSSKDPVFGKCLEKRTSFCCFGSKISRVIQQGAREQLGISWGSAENPDCRPLTLDEFKRVDFTKINMDELFEDLFAKAKPNKKMPTLGHNQIPQAQKDHMEVNTREKREAKKKREEEEARRKAEEIERKKREEERRRLEKLRLEKLERERQERARQERIALEVKRQRELALAQEKARQDEQRRQDAIRREKQHDLASIEPHINAHRHGMAAKIELCHLRSLSIQLYNVQNSLLNKYQHIYSQKEKDDLHRFAHVVISQPLGMSGREYLWYLSHLQQLQIVMTDRLVQHLRN